MTQGPNSTTPALVAERFVEAFNARDEQRLRKLYHPEARIKRPTWPSEGDVAASLASIQLDFGAYPDGQIEVRQVVIQDRVAVVEFQFEGKNTQPLTLFNGQEIPATGRPLRLNGTIVLEVDEQALIRGERQYWEVYPLVEFWMTVGVIGS
jgi:SnoaL-like domain